MRFNHGVVVVALDDGLDLDNSVGPDTIAKRREWARMALYSVRVSSISWLQPRRPHSSERGDPAVGRHGYHSSFGSPVIRAVQATVPRPSAARWLARDELGRLTTMGHSPKGHLEAASRHEDAAGTHERSATFWDMRGDAERAALQRELADYERCGAELERRWAALIERDTAAAE